MTNAIAYVRFSSDRQAEGDSTKRQTDLVKAYCAGKGFSLEMIVSDEGKSAFKGHHISNGELGKFLLEADKGMYQGRAFLIEEIDRLSRQGVLATFELISRILNAGMTVHEINTGRIINELDDLDTADTGILTAVRGILAKDSSRKLKARLLSARSNEREQARKDGLAFTSRCPSWCSSEVGDKVVVIPERKRTVERIFQLASQGAGCKSITTILIAEGKEPFSNGKQGQKWSPEFVQKTLGNRAVLGEFQPHRLTEVKRENGKKVVVRVPEGEPILMYPQIISHELFNAARAMVDSKNHNKGKVGGNRGGKTCANSLFTPLVRDIDNGVPMQFWQKKEDHPYLMSRWAAGKKSHYVRSDKFERAFLAFLDDLDWKAIANESASAETIAAEKELETVLAQHDDSSRKIASLQALVDAGTFSAALFTQLDKENIRHAELNERKAALMAKVESARAKDAVLHNVEDLREALQRGDSPDARMRLRSEIHKRVASINFSFDSMMLGGSIHGEKHPLADIRFVNGARRLIILRDDIAELIWIRRL